MEQLGLLGVLAIGLVAYSLLIGRRVIDDRDRQTPAGNGAELGEVGWDKLGACCGFGLPPVEQGKPAQDRPTPTGDNHPD